MRRTVCGVIRISSSATILPADAASPAGESPALEAAVAPASPAAGVKAHAKRIVGYDLVRAFAAVGVIWVHAGRSPFWREHGLSTAGSWGTAFLNTLAAFFVVYTLRDVTVKGTWKFAVHRVFRLYGSFLLWSLIYVGARVVNYLLFHRVTAMEWSWDPKRMAVYAFFGTTYHLWFLPYLLLITLITLPVVAYACGTRERTLVGACFFALAAVAVLIAPEPVGIHGQEPLRVALAQMYFRSAGFFTGLAIGLWMRAGFRPAITFMQAMAAAGVLVLCVYTALTTELPRHIVHRVGATAAFVFALAPWDGPLARTIGRLGQLGFGVYLCHVLFVEAFLALAARLYGPATFATDLAVFGASVVCSFALAWGMRTTKWLAWAIP